MKIDRASLNDVGRFDFPLRWHQPRIPGYGDINWAAFIGELMRIKVMWTTFASKWMDVHLGKLWEVTKSAIRVARNVLAPFIG